MEKIKTFGPLFVIIAALLWSFDGILRINLYSLPPTVVVFYEHLLGAIILLFFSFKWVKDLKKMSRKEWIAIAIVSLFSGALGTIFYTAALGKVNYSQYSVVVLLQQQLQPIWAIAAAAILLREKITKKFLFWAFLALIAAYFITFKDLRVNISTGSQTAIAGLLALSAGLMWGTSTAISKFVLNKVSFLTGTALRFFMAPVFAFVFILGQGQTSSLFTLSVEQWKMLLLITFSTGLVALAFYYYGLKKTPARITTLCELVWPASAIFIDYFLYHKTLSITQIFGVALLLFAIYKVTKPLAKKSKQSSVEISPAV
ncbi:DMT family transporter [Candidatus Microgenomates bacterium]|nr:MAG: DMT family transporter [Candidatus Microgenomates bacterium]